MKSYHFNKNFLKEVLTLQSESGKEKDQINPDLFKIINRINSKHKLNLTVQEDSVGNIYITKGKSDLYPCIVAHTDNVGKYHNNKTIVEVNDILMAFNETGQIDGHFDDKTGIYIALQALIDLPKLKVVLYANEETGCNGSRVSDLTFLNNVMFVLQSDRKGNSDWITYSNGVDISNKEFQNFIEPIMTPYNYKFEKGLLTDVGELVKRDVGVSCANISSGYYNAHNNNSYCKISEVEACYKLMIDVCLKGIELNKKFEYKYITPVYDYSQYQGKYSFRLSKIVDSIYKEIKKRNRGYIPNVNTMYYTGMKDACEQFVKLLDEIDLEIVQKDLVLEGFIDSIYEYIDLGCKFEEDNTIAKCEGECSFLLDTDAIGGPEEVCIICGTIKPVENKSIQTNMFDNYQNDFEDYYKWK